MVYCPVVFDEFVANTLPCSMLTAPALDKRALTVSCPVWPCVGFTFRVPPAWTMNCVAASLLPSMVPLTVMLAFMVPASRN